MRILFAGTPALAVPALRQVARVADVCAVLTNPDAPSGRGGRLPSSPIKQVALELGLTGLEPERLDQSLRDRVRSLDPELLVVVAYGRIFRPEFLALFPRGAINLHPSLLPRHRGPTPIPATILAGDAEGGVTIQRVAAPVDSGAILAQERLSLEGTETTRSLSERLASLGAELLMSVIRAIQRGTAAGREQEHGRATFCRKLAKADGLIDWREDAVMIARKVRAFDPFPGAYTTFAGRLLHLLEAAPCPPGSELSPSPGVAPGVVLGTDKRYGILVSTGQGFLCVRRLQLEARKALEWREFRNGVPGFVGSRLGESDHATTVDTTAGHE